MSGEVIATLGSSSGLTAALGGGGVRGEVGWTQVVVDDTLSIPGAAADAAAAGAAIDEVRIDDDIVSTKNPWSSSRIAGVFGADFEVSGNPVRFSGGIPGYPLEVQATIPTATQNGTPSLGNPVTINGRTGQTVTVSNGSAERSVSIAFGRTVYGGKVNLTTGALTITHETRTLNGTETFWAVTVGTTTYAYLDDATVAAGAILCDQLPQVSGYSAATTGIWVRSSGGRFGLSALNLISGLDFSAAASSSDKSNVLKSWLAGHPLQVVYTLAQPITVQLTPHELLALAGENTVSADFGTLTVAGKAAAGSAVADLAARVAALEAAAIGNV